MRVVFDTNVFIAAFVSDGICARLVRRARRRELELFICKIVLLEFSSKLKVKFHCTTKEIERACILISEAASAVLTEGVLQTPVCRDRDDDLILACAETAGAEYLVTGDNDLLVLERYGRCNILSPRDFELLFE
ncbi:MAG: putative toxin-antitoxin system toxin component, PIN family [Desulfuromonadales bacterium]